MADEGIRRRRSKKLSSDPQLLLMYQLADRMHKTVAELERDMTVAELAHWIAFFQIRDKKRK
jgi:hypothetical protein